MSQDAWHTAPDREPKNVPLADAKRKTLPAGSATASVPALLLATTLAALSSAPATATPAQQMPSNPRQILKANFTQKIAIFGTDDRRRLSIRYKGLASRIGVLTHAGTGSVCTAFCVSRDAVATAGHCVVGTLNQPVSEPWLLNFRRDSDSGPATPIAGAASHSVSNSILTGARRLNTRPPINASTDWALLRLAAPACKDGGLKISSQTAAEVAASAALGQVYHVAYHRDLAHWKLAIARACTMVPRNRTGTAEQLAKDFEHPGNMLLHACDTDAASSGSPLLVDGDDGPEVVGINVGTYVRSRVITHDGQVVQRLDQEVIANTALLAAPLAGRIRTMTQDGILSRPTEIRRIQEKLAKVGMFSGARDGRYGPITRNAIEAYESHMKLPVTGIATRGLLERLEAVEAVTASK